MHGPSFSNPPMAMERASGQGFGVLRGSFAPASERLLRPEEQLMVEVMVRVCSDLALRTEDGTAWRLRAPARRWVESEDDTWPFSFVRICRHFNVDIQRARRGLLHSVSSDPGGLPPRSLPAAHRGVKRFR